MITPTPFPQLSTSRLLLRRLEEKDAANIFSLRSNPSVNRYLERTPPTLVEEAHAFIARINKSVAANESFYWAITLKGDPQLIGTICIWNLTPDRKKGELGYELLPDYQGKGIMKEAIGRIIDFAFSDLGISCLEAYTHKENLASTKLLLHHHFKEVEGKTDPENINTIIFQLAAEGGC